MDWMSGNCIEVLFHVCICIGVDYYSDFINDFQLDNVYIKDSKYFFFFINKESTFIIHIIGFSNVYSVSSNKVF